MSNSPPPYNEITGTSAIVGKYNQQESIANVDGNARPGQLIVDLDTDPPRLYVGNNLGNISLVGGGSGGGLPLTNGNSSIDIPSINGNIVLTSNGAYVWNFDRTGNTTIPGNMSITGNIIPSSNITYDLGNNTNRFRDLYLANSTIYIGDQTISANATNVILSGVLSGNASGLTDIPAANITGNFSANYSNFAGNLTVVGNENNVYLRTSNANIDSYIQNGNNYTRQYQTQNSWGVYPENGVDGPNIGYAWIETNLANINSPQFFVELAPADTGVTKRWTYDSTGNLTVPGYINGTLDTTVTLGVFNDGGSPAAAIVNWNSDGTIPSTVFTVETNEVVIETNINNGNSQTWTFDNSGNLTLPANTFSVNYANGTQVSLGGGGNVSELVNGNNSFSLSDDPFATTTLATANGDRAVMLIQSDDSTFMVNSLTGNLLLLANDSETWNFDASGNLTFPNGTLINAPSGNTDAEFFAPTGGDFLISTKIPPNQLPQTITLTGADIAEVNTTYTFTVANPPTYYPSDYVPGVDPLIVYDTNVTTWYVYVVAGGAYPYYNTGSNTVPEAQWLLTGGQGGTVAPTGVYTYNSDFTKTWTFDTAGVLTVPQSISWSNDNYIEADNGLSIYSNGGTIINSTVETVITSNSYQWRFKDDGALSIPDIILFNNDSTIGVEGSALAVSGVGGVVVSGGTGNINLITSGLYTWNFDTTGNLVLPANTFSVNYANGDPVSLGGGNTGNIVFSDTIIYVAANTASQFLRVAYNGEGFSYLSLPSDAEANANNAILTNDNGNVQIGTRDYDGSGPYYNWLFDKTGNLTLPANTFSVNYANGVQVSLGGGNTGNVTFDDNIVIGTGAEDGGNGLFLATGPNGAANLQYLRLRGGDFPTHIHLDTGNNAYYDQYFGNDNKFVKLEAGDTGNIVIGTDDGNGNLYNWTFDSAGNLTLPANTFSVNYANGDPVPLGATYGDSNVISLLGNFEQNPIGNIGSISFINSDDLRGISYTPITPGAGGLTLSYGETTSLGLDNSGINLVAPGGTWNFGNTGNLTLPGNTFAVNYANGTPVSLGSIQNIIQNGGSEVSIPVDDGDIETRIDGTLVLTITPNGANIDGNLTATGNIFAPALVQNASTYDTRIELSSGAGIIQANVGGNATQFLPGGQIRLSGAKTIYGGTLDGSQIVLGDSQTDLVQNRGGNVTIQVGDGGTTANTWTFAQGGNLNAPGAISATGNITGGNLSTPGDLSVTGNITGGNIIGVLANGNSNVSIATANSNVTITSNGTHTWTFDDTGDLTLPTISLGASLSEKTTIQSQRKIIPPLHYSVVITGTTPTVVYTATDYGLFSLADISSMKVTIQIQHTNLGMEFFEVYATATGADTYYTVSNRLHPPEITDTVVLVDLNGSNKMQITLTITSGAATSYVTYDSTEFGIPGD